MAIPAALAAAARVAPQVGQGLGTAGAASGFYPPFSVWLARTTFDGWPNRIPPLPELVQLRMRGLINTGQYDQWGQENGFDTALSEMLFKGSHQILGASDIISLNRRGLMPEGEANERLKKAGWDSDDWGRLKEALDYVPTVQDAILFAAREVFSPQQREALGLNIPAPPDFVAYAKQLGLKEDDAQRYWAAHWRLPSINQVFEMLHRGVVTQEEVNSFLKAADYNPNWHDKLTQISYRPLTRVDVRRAYRIGVLTEQDVFKSYKDQGYSEQNARVLTDFTVKYENTDNLGVTVGKVRDSYKKGLINEEQFKAYLKILNYSDQAIALEVANTNYDIEEKRLEALADELGAQYRLGLISLEDVAKALASADAPASWIDTTVNKLKSKASAKVKLPSKADLTDWLNKAIISEIQFYRGMVSLGYRESDVRNYLAEIKIDNEDDAVKFLGVKTYHRWLISGIMSEGAFRAQMQAMKTSEADTNRLIQEAQQKSAPTGE